MSLISGGISPYLCVDTGSKELLWSTADSRVVEREELDVLGGLGMGPSIALADEASGETECCRPVLLARRTSGWGIVL